jgi:hypothetical protein
MDINVPNAKRTNCYSGHCGIEHPISKLWYQSLRQVEIVKERLARVGWEPTKEELRQIEDNVLLKEEGDKSAESHPTPSSMDKHESSQKSELSDRVIGIVSCLIAFLPIYSDSYMSIQDHIHIVCSISYSQCDALGLVFLYNLDNHCFLAWWGSANYNRLTSPQNPEELFLHWLGINNELKSLPFY